MEAIAAQLAADLPETAPAGVVLHPLRVRLDELCGLVDPTIAKLTAIAANGILTTASAARLAMRHASEVGVPDAVGPICEEADRLSGAIVGRPPSDYCLHLGYAGDPRAPRIASAPIRCSGRIAESGFRSGPAVCLFVGDDANGALVFATQVTADWGRTVSRMQGTARLAFASRVLLLSWSEAGSASARSALADDIERKISAGGRAKPLPRRRRTDPALRNPTPPTSDALLLIGAACPDLFGGNRT